MTTYQYTGAHRAALLAIVLVHLQAIPEVTLSLDKEIGAMVDRLKIGLDQEEEIEVKRLAVG